MAEKYIVNLSAEERGHLQELTRKGTVVARKATRAHILLHADEGATDEAIAHALHVGVSTVHRTRQRCVEEGVEAALQERPRPGARRKLDGKQEAYLVALACSDPPQGHACWTMRLLADTLVDLEMVPFLSDETVRRLLANSRSSRGSRSSGASPASVPSL
jgi:transposase